MVNEKSGMHQFPKRCSCGRVFQDYGAWDTLGIVGAMNPKDGKDPTYFLELRNCSCTSTLVIKVAVGIQSGSKSAMDQAIEEVWREKSVRK